MDADKCPICGAISMNGDPCQPYCEAGNCHAHGIELMPCDSNEGRLPENSKWIDHDAPKKKGNGGRAVLEQF